MSDGIFEFVFRVVGAVLSGGGGCCCCLCSFEIRIVLPACFVDKMANMTYSLLKEVNADTQKWRIRIRIARLWEHWDTNKQQELLRIQFVMVDEKGEGMQGSIPKGQLQRFRDTISEGHVYYMEFLEIKPARDLFRAVHHRFEATFTRWTKVVEINVVADTFPLYAYKLRSFQNILDNVTDKTFLADVIGVITGVSPIVRVDVKGRPTSKRSLRITDTRDTASVALWNSNAEEFKAEELIAMSKKEPIIVLVMGCTFKRHESSLSLSASYGSKVYINATNPDVVALRDRIHDVSYPIEWISEKAQRFESTEIESTNVAYLSTCVPHIILNKLFRCKIVIAGVSANQNWWFLSCDECTYKSVAEGDAYKCTNVSCANKTAGPRYRLSLLATDEGSTVEMVLFGDLAEDLIGKKADVLLAESYRLSEALPLEISRLIGRSYVVDVTVSRISFRRDDISFQVIKFYPQGTAMFTDFINVAEISGILPRAECSSSYMASPTIDTQEHQKGIILGDESQPAVSITVENPVLYTPPASILQGAEQITERTNTNPEALLTEALLATEQEQTKRRRTTGSKSNVSKSLFTKKPEQSDTRPSNE